ncbi:MAG: hypothetical protein ABTQ34_06350 [Bdellovibrionales bacterium]
MSLKDTISCAEELLNATVSSGASLSGAMRLGGLRLFGFIMPSSWDAAELTVLGSFDGGTTFVPIKSSYDGTEITFVVNASGFFPLPNPQIFAAVPMIKLQSGTSASPVNQAADRAIQLVLRSI